jgi:hypothetical protein
MLMAGIVGFEGKEQIAKLANSILAASGKKISVIDASKIAHLSEKRMSDYLNVLKSEFVDILIIKIGLELPMIIGLKALTFDVLIFTASKLKSFDEENKKKLLGDILLLYERLCENGTLIISSDEDVFVDINNTSINQVTYGFSKNANVATSSVGDDPAKSDMLLSLQKSVLTSNGNRIEPQEYRFRCSSGGFDTDNILAAASFAIINDIDLNTTNVCLN